MTRGIQDGRCTSKHPKKEQRELGQKTGGRRRADRDDTQCWAKIAYSYSQICLHHILARAVLLLVSHVEKQGDYLRELKFRSPSRCWGCVRPPWQWVIVSLLWNISRLAGEAWAPEGWFFCHTPYLSPSLRELRICWMQGGRNPERLAH